MDVVPGTVELPGKKIQKQFEKAIDPSCATVKALLRAHDITQVEMKNALGSHRYMEMFVAFNVIKNDNLSPQACKYLFLLGNCQVL